ncbi:hypothetical protein FSP39_023609 [Pinctada imbricata]|uniref:Uncharacterized protein n=1 Tax=Pinctada imbricata TaxID=66713 RepID=A0AA89BJT5_PINIB|nr:hypothetical protein FSP39_023609 [Pinctada imbricata]
MIEEEEDNDDDLELSGRSTDTSVVTWTIHEDSELIQLEDSYMRNIDNKLVPVFGFTAKNSYAKYSTSSTESLKYEDGRTSVVLSDKFQSQPGPLMNSTRNDFHFVPEPKVDVCGDEEVTSMFEDPNHVTPENPLGLEQKAMIKKPTKAKKFSNIFKQNRLKQAAQVENSPTKKKLFSSEISKESHALGKIRIMKKLKQFGDTLRSTDKQNLKQLAIL